ncbi:glutathione peroxidase [Sphingobacteriales bacterium UPWRP_1]|nr:glutathione peroxidase [Sphingobacteriales bacterium TSM_CSM]PSJ78491.1 glutathione peroxidase [Sphingobacteriales bacterium UPWRP_1]
MTIRSGVHGFELPGLNGKPIVLADFAGKKILLVNTASECGYTPQYARLQELSTHFNNSLVVIGCPSNDFGNQEPGTNEEIAAFCNRNYGISFPMSEKLKVTGPGKHPLYRWLYEQNQQREVGWNFQKFLFDENGQLIKVFGPGTDPLSEELLLLLH